MKFSLVHPSRSRAVQAEDAIREWTSKCSGVHEREYILSVDTDDTQLAAYRVLATRQRVRLLVNPNRSLIGAVNHGAAVATGDLIIVVSDDFGCPQDWDLALAAVVQGRRDTAVIVDDGFGAVILTLPIIGRDLYRSLGYVYHPAYISMFCDTELTEVARRRGVLIDARHLRFQHRHYTAGLSPYDATYERQNSDRAWWHGWRVFETRKIDGFGERRAGLGPRLARLRIDAYYWLRVSGSVLRQRWLALLPSPLRRFEERFRDRVLGWADPSAPVDAPVEARETRPPRNPA